VKFSNTKLDLYKTFVVVFETQNTTKAAELLFTSQSTVSYTIKELEKQLDTQLFIPITKGSVRGVKPTQAAVELYDYVVSALTIINNGENKIQQFNELSSGVIRIGCPPYISNFILLDYFCEFNKKYPRIRLEMTNKLKSELVELLEKQDIDFLIDISPVDNENFITAQLMPMKYTLFTSKEFIKQNHLQQSIHSEQLKTLPVILHNKSNRMIKDLNEKLGFEIQPSIVATSTEFMYSMVLKCSGIGYCVEDFLSVNKNESIVKLKLTNKELPNTSLVFAYNKDCTNKATQVFLNGLKAFCQKTNAPMIDIFDENMNHIGSMEKKKAHDEFQWHKSVHVWITDGKNILMQLRAPNKKSFPNKWDISVAGHVDAGETPLQAAKREYEEELGIEWDLGELKENCILTKGTIENGRPANEFLFIYFVNKKIDLSKLNLPEHEVADVKYIPYGEFIKSFMSDTNDFIPYPKHYKDAIKNGLAKLINKK
jgi:DNA-binding transcriptional LysR family regulator/isopentenyldiphosphate isomerase